MKRNTVILVITMVIMIALVGCDSTVRSTPTGTPTLLPTQTSTPEPTSTETPSPTFTPTFIPTLAFFSVSPTIIATSSSCNPFPQVICVPNLTITLTGRRLNNYTVNVSWPGFSGTSFACPIQFVLITFGDQMTPVNCDSDQITFISVGLTEINVTISWDGGSITETLHPTYEISAPAGTECYPQCLMGSTEINIP